MFTIRGIDLGDASNFLGSANLLDTARTAHPLPLY